MAMSIKSTDKPAHVGTSIKQSPVLKGHISYPIINNFISIEPLLRCHMSYKATLYFPQMWPLKTGLTVYDYQYVIT
jgi:hypothetical protein